MAKVNNVQTNTSTSLSYTASSDARQILVVTCWHQSSNTITATYNGVSLSLATSVYNDSTAQRAHILYLVNPATGSNTLSFSSTGGGFASTICVLTDMNTSSPVGGTTTNINDNPSGTVTVTGQAGVVIDSAGAVGNDYPSLTRSGGTSLGTSSTVVTCTDAGYTLHTGSNISVSFSGSRVNDSALCMAEFKDAAIYTLVAGVGSFTASMVDMTIRKQLFIVFSTLSFSVTMIGLAVGRSYRMIASVGSFILTGVDAIFNKFSWTNRTKPSTTFTDRTKPSTSFTDRTKPTTNWTKIDKY